MITEIYLSMNYIVHIQNDLKIKIASTASFKQLSEIVESTIIEMLAIEIAESKTYERS